MKASPMVAKLARQFLSALFDDMEAKQDTVVAEWTGRGYLFVVASGWKADRLDAFLRDEEIAVPRHRAEVSA